MINLFETFDTASRDLLLSQKIAKIYVDSVVINDDGFLPDELDSPVKYFCRLNSNHRPLYFDQVKIPHFWRIMATAQGGQVYDLKTKKANIVFTKTDNSRIVHEVQWLDETGQIAWADRYDKHATRYAKVYYDNGQPAVIEYYDIKGNKVIEHNLRSGDLFLEYRGHRQHFNDLADFVIYYLHLRKFNLNHIIYNTLNISLAVSLRLPLDQGTDMLCWHEKLGDDLPGNMKFLLDNQTRTTKIIFQNYADWQSKKSLIPESSKIDFSYLGTIYPHPRSNQLRSSILVLTNSDQVEQLQRLAELMPQCTINVAAITEMSDKLLVFDDYDNVELFPQISHDKLMDLMHSCDIYLDINHGNELLDVVRGAFEQNMLILGFKNTIHESQFIANENIYDANENGATMMAQKVLSALVKPKLMEQLIDKQRAEAGDSRPQDYQRVFGAWNNE